MCIFEKQKQNSAYQNVIQEINYSVPLNYQFPDTKTRSMMELQPKVAEKLVENPPVFGIIKAEPHRCSGTAAQNENALQNAATKKEILL